MPLRLVMPPYMSHPAGVRGLKQRCVQFVGVKDASHPAGVRGLKPPGEAMKLLAIRRTPQGCVD